MNRYLGTTARLLATVAFGLLSLPGLAFALYLFGCWVRIHTTHAYYVEYPYFVASLVFIGIGALSLFCAIYGAWRRSFGGLLFGVPLVLGIALMLYMQEDNPHRRTIEDLNYMEGSRAVLGVWYATNRYFPKNTAEFKEALKDGAAAWLPRYGIGSVPGRSSYCQNGRWLSYEFVVTNDALGPRINDAGSRPGVVYYSVSSDLQQFWLTMTVLQDDVSTTATLQRLYDRHGKVLVVTAKGEDYPVKAAEHQ